MHPKPYTLARELLIWHQWLTGKSKSCHHGAALPPHKPAQGLGFWGLGFRVLRCCSCNKAGKQGMFGLLCVVQAAYSLRPAWTSDIEQPCRYPSLTPLLASVLSMVLVQAMDEVSLVPPARQEQVRVLKGPKAGQVANMLSVDDKDGVLHWRDGEQTRHDWQKMDILGLLVQA